jgi:hypothetical protein
MRPVQTVFFFIARRVFVSSLTLCNNFSYDQPTDLHPYLALHFKTYQSTHNLQPANSYKCTQLTPKTASVVPPEDERLTPETCRLVEDYDTIK